MERKNRQNILRGSEEQYRLIFENSGEGILLTGPDGTVYSANPEACRIFGMSEDEIRKAGRTGLIDLDDPTLEASLTEKRKNGRFKGELNVLRRNGEKFPVEVNSTIFMDTSGNERTTLIISDISKRKHYEMTLLLQSEILKNISDGINLIKLSDETIVFTNPCFDKMFGYRSGELIGKDVSILNAATDMSPEDIKQNILNTLNLTGTWSGEMLNRKKNGDLFWCSSTVTMFDHLSYGKVCLSVHSDITRRIAEEAKLRKSKEKLRKSKELLEKLLQHQNEIRENERAIISRVVHDELGQSMTALKLDLNQLRKYLGNNTEALNRLDSMIDLMSLTIKTVQSISSDLRPGILDDLGLVAAIEWYSDEFENRTGIKCNLELDDSGYNDPRKSLTFFRVLQEALTNVIRHARATSINIELHNSHKGTTLLIQDNGIGIPEGKIKSHNSLGLINIRERVRQFNGKVTTLSNPGEGTKIIVFIPFNK